MLSHVVRRSCGTSVPHPELIDHFRRTMRCRTRTRCTLNASSDQSMSLFIVGSANRGETRGLCPLEGARRNDFTASEPLPFDERSSRLKVHRSI